jgi:hypothetical protein
LELKATAGVRSVGKVTERLGAEGDRGKEGSWRLTKGVELEATAEMTEGQR